MFKTKNNLRRNIKHKEHKNTKKPSQYVEDYNEIILNDLVDDNHVNKENEVQEEPIRKTKKKKAINFNLGAKKKSTSDEDKKAKPLNKKHKSHSDEPKEIVDVENKKDTPEIESKPKDNKSSKTNKSTKSSKSNKSSKSAKPEKESKKSKKNSKNQSNEESTKKSSKKTSKKDSKPTKEDKSKKTSKKSRKEEDLKTKSVEDIEIEEIEELNEDTVEGSVFRNIEEDEGITDDNPQIEVEETESEHKFDDIIWSDDKFPKN